MYIFFLNRSRIKKRNEPYVHTTNQDTRTLGINKTEPMFGYPRTWGCSGPWTLYCGR